MISAPFSIKKGLLKNRILKNQVKEKVARTVKAAVLANFINVKIFRLGLKTAFCNRPLLHLNKTSQAGSG